MSWTELDSIVHRVPLKHHLFILMVANARTGVRTSEEERKILGAYGRDLRANDSNGIAPMQFSSGNKLALVNTFFSTPKGNTSRTFNGDAYRPADKQRIDYIITRQGQQRRLVRNVTVHRQPPNSPDSDHNIVCASVRLLGRFAHNRPRRNLMGRSSIDRPAIISLSLIHI